MKSTEQDDLGFYYQNEGDQLRPHNHRPSAGEVEILDATYCFNLCGCNSQPYHKSTVVMNTLPQPECIPYKTELATLRVQSHFLVIFHLKRHREN